MGTTQYTRGAAAGSTAYRLTLGPPARSISVICFSNKTHEGQKCVEAMQQQFLDSLLLTPRLPSYVKFRISFFYRERYTSILIFIKGHIPLTLFRFDFRYFKTSINVEIEL
jgi:hypothetical protein